MYYYRLGYSPNFLTYQSKYVNIRDLRVANN